MLKNDLDATIYLPTDNEMQKYIQQFCENILVWVHRNRCIIVGLKLMLQQAPNSMIQEQVYNDWTHDHYVMSVLCFCPDGMIPIAAFNMPGSFHDSTVAEYGGVYAKLEAMFNKYGVKCTADSAFGGKTYPFLIKSSQDPLLATGETQDEIVAQVRIQLEATSMRQAAEWGMRAVQSSFPRLKD